MLYAMKYSNDAVTSRCDDCGDPTSLDILARNHGVCDECATEREENEAIEREAQTLTKQEAQQATAQRVAADGQRMLSTVFNLFKL